MKKILAAIAILLACTPFFSPFYVKGADNLVGYWKFDQGSGTSPVDSSGENVSGSFTATQPTWSTDVPSTQFSNPYSLDFSGTGDGITIAWPSALNFAETAPRSFSFWYKPTGDGENASGNFDRIISWSDDKFEIAGTFGDVSVHRLAFYDGTWRDTGFNMSVGTWYNITFTYDGTNIKLFVNNVERFSGTSAGRALSGTMYIGTRHTGDEGINGRVDDVRVYDRALTLSEVQNISEGGSGPGLPTSTPTPSPTPTPTSTPTPTATLTPTRTPTPSPTTSTSSSSTSSSSTGSISSVCSSQKPSSAPDLFQISTSPTTATLYFTPVSPATGYIVSYGTTPEANQYSYSFSYSNGSGAASYTIKELSRGTHYYFKIQGKNDCTAGDWSAALGQTTTGGSQPSSLPSPTPRGTIQVVEKKQETTKQAVQPQELETNETENDTSPSKAEGYELVVEVIHEGKPVEGATVEVHSTPRKTTTDKDGIARFPDMEKGEHTVFLSYEGFQGKEQITLDGKDKDVTMSFTVELQPSNTFLSPLALGIIAVLCIGILILFILLKKRRKKSSL